MYTSQWLKHGEEAECESTILRLESEQRIFDTISSHLGHEGMWNWGSILVVMIHRYS